MVVFLEATLKVMVGGSDTRVLVLAENSTPCFDKCTLSILSRSHGGMIFSHIDSDGAPWVVSFLLNTPLGGDQTKRDIALSGKEAED